VFAEIPEPRQPPAILPHHCGRVEFDALLVDWVQFRFCRKSYGHSSYFLPLLHYTCYCVHFPHMNATGCGLHVLKIRKSVRYWLGYVCGKLFAKENYYSICWKIYKGLETKTIVCCDSYHEAFSTFKCKLKFECASVKILTIIHEDYEYCIYLIIDLFDHAILHTVTHHFLNLGMLLSLVFNLIATTFLYVFDCWVLRFQRGLVDIEATFSVDFTCWVIAVRFGLPKRTCIALITYGRMSKGFIEFQGKMFLSAALSLLEELLSFLGKLLVWNSFVVGFDRSFIANLKLSPFMNHILDGLNDMIKHYSHQFPLVPIFGLSYLKNVVGGSKDFYHAEQSLENKLKWYKALRIGKVWLILTSTVTEFLRHPYFRDCDMLVMPLVGMGKNTSMLMVDGFKGNSHLNGLHGVHSDTIHVVWVQVLLAWMFHIEVIIEDIKIVEVGMMERIRHKKMLPSPLVQTYLQLIYVLQFLLSVQDINVSSHSDTLEFSHVQIVEPLEVETLNSQTFLIQYNDYSLGSDTWIVSPCLFNFWLLFTPIVFTVQQVSELDVNGTSSNVLTEVGQTSFCDKFPILCAYFEQWDLGGHLDVSTRARSSHFKQWDPGKLIHSLLQHLQP